MDLCVDKLSKRGASKKSRNNNDFTVTPPELRAVKAVMCTMWDPTGADPGIFDWGGI